MLSYYSMKNWIKLGSFGVRRVKMVFFKAYRQREYFCSSSQYYKNDFQQQDHFSYRVGSIKPAL